MSDIAAPRYTARIYLIVNRYAIYITVTNAYLRLPRNQLQSATVTRGLQGGLYTLLKLYGFFSLSLRPLNNSTLIYFTLYHQLKHHGYKSLSPTVVCYTPVNIFDRTDLDTSQT